MKREDIFRNPDDPVNGKSSEIMRRSKLWENDEGQNEEVVAVLGHELVSSDRMEVAQKIQQLDQFIGRGDNGDEASGAELVDGGLNEEDKQSSLVEDVKEVVESLEHSVHDLFHHHHKKQASDELSSIDAASSIDSRASSFSEGNKERRRHRFLNKVKHGLGKAKEEYDKAKDELKAIVHKDKSQHGYDQPHETYSESDSDSDSSTEKKSPSVVEEEVKAPTLAQKLLEEEAAEIPNIAESIQEEVVVEAPNNIAQSVQEEVAEAPKIAQSIQEEVAEAPKIAQSIQEEVAEAPKIAQSIQEEVAEAPKITQSIQEVVKAPNIAQRIQEEVVAVISTIDEAKKTKDTKQEKKEDNCITSLAQGLQNLCSWGSKKED